MGRELVRVDPLDEAGHRLRIEAHHAAGDRAGAVRAYHECVATLERELGVEPAQATTALHARVLETPANEPPERRQSARTRPGLVGREQEWQQLMAAWRAAEDGSPCRRVGHRGTGDRQDPPGRGAPDVVRRLGSHRRRGAVLRHRRRPRLRRCGVVAAVAGHPGRSGPASCPVSVLELARLLPELGPTGSIQGADDAERRLRLFDAAAAALASPGRPTLLVADDCQWSDQVSQEFIHYLLRQRRSDPLLVVLTARREELDSGHPMTALSDSLAVLDRLTELSLDRLSRDATGEIGSQLAGSRLAERTIEALFADSEGNPLFIVETMRSGWDGRAGQMDMTPRLRAVIDARFHRLSDVAATVLGAIAVVGRPCSARLLAPLCDLDDRSLARGLDELWHRGILSETGSDSYEFSHGKLRDAAYENLSPGGRRARHGVAAEVLAAGGRPGSRCRARSGGRSLRGREPAG